jgi:sphinganine-1-phosphate aldolase
MQDLLEIAKDLPKQQSFACVLIATFFLGKSHYYRFLRSYAIPTCTAVILFRILKTNSKSLLDEITEILSKSTESRAVKIAIGDAVGLVVCLKFLDFADKLITVDFDGLKRTITDFGFGLIKNTSFVKAKLQKEQSKLETDFDKELKTRSRALGEINLSLPKNGLQGSDILDMMRTNNSTENDVWESGKLSGAVYCGLRDHTSVLNQAFGLYSISNPLHPEIWPSVMKYDSEIIAMTAALVSGGLDTVCGTTSSGGTESIIMAIKAHRDYYRDNFGINNPEMVVGVSAHAAVDKACDMMKIKLIKVALDPVTFKIDLSALRRAIGPNTIMMYSSAPNYPYGTIDDIAGMSKIALQYNIGLHVDCCLGGFILPFAKKLGHAVPGISS